MTSLGMVQFVNCAKVTKDITVPKLQAADPSLTGSRLSSCADTAKKFQPKSQAVYKQCVELPGSTRPHFVKDFDGEI